LEQARGVSLAEPLSVMQIVSSLSQSISPDGSASREISNIAGKTFEVGSFVVFVVYKSFLLMPVSAILAHNIYSYAIQYYVRSLLAARRLKKDFKYIGHR
jgi:hypothetical protein